MSGAFLGINLWGVSYGWENACTTLHFDSFLFHSKQCRTGSFQFSADGKTRWTAHRWWDVPASSMSPSVIELQMNPKGGGEISWLLGSVSSCGGFYHPCSAIMQLGSLGRCLQGSWERSSLVRPGQESPFPHRQLQEIFDSRSGCASLVTSNVWEPLEAELTGAPNLQLAWANPAASHCPRL